MLARRRKGQAVASVEAPDEQPEAGADWEREAVGRPPLLWLLDILSLSFALARMAITPGTWRPPVRRQLVLALDGMGVQAVPIVTVIAILSGIVVVGQGSYWLREFGDLDFIRRALGSLLTTMVAPIVVMLFLLGRGGFLLSGALVSLRRGGQMRALLVVGIDPLALVVLPGVLAGTIAAIVLTLLFGVLAVASGLVAAALTGVITFSSDILPLQVLSELGRTELPLALGQAATMTWFALVAMADAAIEPMHVYRTDRALARGFFRAIIYAGLIALAFTLWR